MKVEINPGSEKEISFPKLRKTTFLNGEYIIVLFNNKSTGTVIYLSGVAAHYFVGYSSPCWGPEEFEDFVGSITLEND